MLIQEQADESEEARGDGSEYHHGKGWDPGYVRHIFVHPLLSCQDARNYRNWDENAKDTQRANHDCGKGYWNDKRFKPIHFPLAHLLELLGALHVLRGKKHRVFNLICEVGLH